nr:ATP-binding protein [Kofleriaceae bacterium]
MSVVIARAAEKQQLDDALRSPNAELIAVYGRRRVGKTFLIRQHYAAAICFELVGIHDASLAVQLRSFAHTLATAVGRGRASAPPPVDWHAAFRQLTDWLQTCKPKRGKRVVFFDELPWLASRRSGFLPAFEHFWNAWAAQQPWLVVVVCGSAASWMLEKVVRQRGGLHNRVTRRLRVEPFSLADARTLLASRGVDLGNYQTAELYMALGGIPFYLAAVRGSESAAQNIDRLCFA